MSRGKRATVGDEGGPPTPSQISKTCPSCGCDAFDALHSEPGELQRRHSGFAGPEEMRLLDAELRRRKILGS